MRTRFVATLVGVCLTMGQVAEAQTAAKRDTAVKVRAILESACYRCHGDNGTIEGGFNYILNRAQMVSRKQIIPGASDRSRLIRRIVNEEMPPEGEMPRLTKEQVDVLSEWINSGAQDFNSTKAAREFISASAMQKSMREDLKQRDPADRPFTRYLTLTHLYNAGRSEDELQGYRNGISKLVNSLSWGRKVATPTPIATQPSILRIDLRDYKWPANTWDRIAAADPYGLTNTSNSDSKELYSETRCALPHVRGDWFVAAAARPPLYHDILQLPSTIKELETLLHVEVDENLSTGQAARSAFNGSAVSRNNRLIERHDSSYGYYWKSYDFAKNTDRQNLFAHPLGPGPETDLFKHDGGEMIFSLPNGFQAYMLANADGQRIDKGPIDIVSDQKRPDRTVENGLSCMSCHVRGLLPKDDQILAHVQKNPGAFSKSEVKKIFELYPKHEAFQKLIDDDAAAFRKALDLAKIPPSRGEPIIELTTLFESELDLSLAAAEASLKPDEFQKILKQSNELARVLGSLQSADGTVQRDVFTNTFALLARTAKLGTPVDKAALKQAVATRDNPSGKPKQITLLGKKKTLPSGWNPAGFTTEKEGGIRLNKNSSIVSKDRNYLSKDFTLEVVLAMKAGDPIAVIGIGDNSAGTDDPKYSFRMRIHPPNVSKGQVYVTLESTTLTGNATLSSPGTHLFRIVKEGPSVTLMVDPDNDGESDDDGEYTLPDIKDSLPKLNDKNTNLFFGGGGVYKSVSLTVGGSEK